MQRWVFFERHFLIEGEVEGSSVLPFGLFCHRVGRFGFVGRVTFEIRCTGAKLSRCEVDAQVKEYCKP